MGIIVCATRGGAGSRLAQEKAIEHALQSGHSLAFLYVVDAEKLIEADSTLFPAVKNELAWLGETLLRIALRRAEGMGVDAEIAIRCGNIVEEIGRFLEETSAEMLFLGAPRSESADSLGMEGVHRLARALGERTKAQVEVVTRAED